MIKLKQLYEKVKQKKSAVILSISFLFVIIIGLLWLGVVNHGSRISNLETSLVRVQFDIFEIKPGLIDLSASTLQSIGNGFLVGSVDMQQHLTGIKVSGTLVNAQSLTHTNAVFVITLDQQQKDIAVNYLPSGGSAKFSVYVPDVKPENAHFGTIKYQRSTVNFR